MIFAHGTILPDADLPALLDGLEEELNSTRADLTLEAEAVVSAIDALGRRLDSGALNHLIAQFAAPNTLDSLAQIRPALCREALEDKLKTELSPEALSPQPRPFGRARYLPLGVLFHVTVGNVAGLLAFSAVEGLLTGNINLLKLPREDKGLTLAILFQLTDQEPRLAPFLYAFDVPSSDTARLKRLAAREGRSPGQAAEATLYSYEALLEQAVDRRDFDDRFFPGRGCSITLRRDKELELSHLHGNVLVKCLPRRELLPVLRRQKGRLQTAGLLCARSDREVLADPLSRAGLTRITRASHMSHTLPGERHDGEYPLRRYVRVVDTED